MKKPRTVNSGRLVWGAVLASLAAASVSAGPAGFAAKPSVARSGEKVSITFSVTAPTDVEVAVVKDGKVARHLAAGKLGDKSPAPLQKGLAQSLVWDLKDDAGKTLDPAGATVRVGLGMTPRFDKIIGWSGQWLAEANGIFCGPDGMLYAIHRGDYLPHRHSWIVSAFDGNGEYHHQVYPGPGDLPPDKRKGWPWVETSDGQKMPVVQQHLNRCFYPAARFHYRNFMVVTRDNRLIIPTGAKEELRSEGPDIRGGR